MDNTTPAFCQGFLRYCTERGLQPSQVRTLVEKSAAFHPTVAEQWRLWKKTADDGAQISPMPAQSWWEKLKGGAGALRPDRLYKHLTALPDAENYPQHKPLGKYGPSLPNSRGLLRLPNQALQYASMIGGPAKGLQALGPAVGLSSATAASRGAAAAGIGAEATGMVGGAADDLAVAAGPGRLRQALTGGPAKWLGGAAGLTALTAAPEVISTGLDTYKGKQMADGLDSIGNELAVDPQGTLERLVKDPAQRAAIQSKIEQQMGPRVAERIMGETFNPQKQVAVPSSIGTPMPGAMGITMPTLPGQAQVPDRVQQATNAKALADNPVVQDFMKQPGVQAAFKQFMPQGSMMGGLQGAWDWLVNFIKEDPARAAMLGIGIPLALKGLFSGGQGSSWALPAGVGLAGAGLLAPQLKEMFRNWQASQAQASRTNQMTQPWWGPPGERELPNPREAVAQLPAPGQPGGQTVVG